MLNILLIFLLPVFARWGTPEEANIAINRENLISTIDEKGFASSLYEKEIEILKEGGKNEASIAHFDYNFRSQEIKVIEAKTINKDGEYAVRTEFIEDKPKASTPNGFDEFHQLMIVFPRVDVGSRLYFKLQIKDKEVAFPKYYARSFSFGWGTPSRARSIEINSKIPLNIAVNDPRGELRVTQKNGTYVKVETKKQLYFEVLDETKGILDTKNIPWFDISTNPDPQNIMRDFSPRYENLLKAELPALHQAMLKQGKKGKSDIEIINLVTAELQTKTRYMGDWRPVNGGYVPRNLKTISDTAFGDCKDFSISTVAVLRKLGFRAHPAFVYRGLNYNPRPTEFKTLLTDFNHAIVFAQKDGHDYWIDPTNNVSFAQGIFGDIDGRPAFVLDPENLQTRFIPDSQAKDRVFSYQSDVTYLDRETVEEKSRLTLAGTSAITLTGYELSHSRAQTEYEILNYLTSPSLVKKSKIAPFDLSSRIVKNLEFNGTMELENPILKTSAGLGLRLTSTVAIADFLTSTKDRVSDLNLQWAREYSDYMTIKDSTIEGNNKLSCSVRSKWLNATREINQVGKDIVVDDKLTIEVARIPIADLLSKEYKTFQKEIRGCFDEVGIIISNRLFPTSH